MQHQSLAACPARDGPADWFTGRVTIAPVVDAPGPARLRAACVTFAPGARTHWHTHPLGQAIHVLSGRGLAQADGGPVIHLCPGDTVWFAPHERHWHGAAPHEGMVHLAMQEALDGVSVTWGDPVTDADYAA
ncbi:MAG: cupin domain-containing protein [Rhodobacteraceae bacterium]|jgi:quercetin dioxygenase-like cupin family protein|nr:cupin domain-containing protein [Paracoccaceae bacterium]